MELVRILKGVELFRGLNTAQLEQVIAISQKEQFSEGKTIVNQGDPGDKMYIISDGQVEVRVDDGKGGAHTAVYLGQGQIFGEMALLERAGRSASVVASRGGAEVHSIPGDAFESLWQNDTAIGYIMMRNMALDLSFKLRHQNVGSSADEG
jgi:CRP/FNR family cyclic AMP-dependent transcriptional regulator